MKQQDVIACAPPYREFTVSPRADPTASLLDKKESEMAENLSAVQNLVELRISNTSADARNRGAVSSVAKLGLALLGCAALASCASNHYSQNGAAPTQVATTAAPTAAAPASAPVVATPPVRAKNGTEKPYVVGGKRYVPATGDSKYTAVGLASWYGAGFHGRKTADGERFDMMGLTAAHKTMPLPSYARVTNLETHKSLVVRVNDRGPYHGNRLIDVSNKAAELLEFKGNGIARVRVEYVGRAPLEGSDDRQLIATLRTGEPAPSPSVVRVASARSFVPDMQGGRVVSRDIPMPEGRPYSLGNTPADRQISEISSSGRYRSASAYPTQNPRAVSYEGNPDYAAPAEAMAPDNGTVDARGAAAILSGRGLY
jgi:rare lipoprotein A